MVEEEAQKQREQVTDGGGVLSYWLLDIYSQTQVFNNLMTVSTKDLLSRSVLQLSEVS